MPGPKRPPSPSSIPIRQPGKGGRFTPPVTRKKSDSRLNHSDSEKHTNGQESPGRNHQRLTRLPTPLWAKKKSNDKSKESGDGQELPDKSDSGLELNQDEQEKSGVMYITENLIKRITKEDNLKAITHLSLTLSRETNRKIKYIENLEGLSSLKHLSLAHNMIEKIEKIDRLTKLQGLDLSHNQIRKIEGLETLINLKVLNLNDNLIANVPAILWKKLSALRAVKLAMNHISTTHDLLKLRVLPDLTDIYIEGNPFCSLAHHREIIICHLRSLETIDGVPVSDSDRLEADKRFGQGELKDVTDKLSQAEKKLNESLTEKQLAGEKIDTLHQNEKKLKALLHESKDRIKELEKDLSAKEDLLNSKNAELSRACEKQYKLEQELAFFKLDAKFEELWKVPPRNYEFEENGYVDSGDSTYIGKAKFKPNSYAREASLPTREQLVNFIRFTTTDNPETREKNRDIVRVLEECLQTDLLGRQEAVLEAAQKLKELQAHVEDMERRAAEGRANLTQHAVQVDGPIGDIKDREKARQHLIDMVKQAKELQLTVKELQEKLEEVEDELADREKEIKKLNEVVATLAEGNPNMERLRSQLTSKQRQYEQNLLEKKEIEKLLNEAETELEKQLREVRTLEAKLKGGDKDAQDQIRKELEAVVEKLTNNLKIMSGKDKEQQRKLDALHKEKSALNQQLQDAVDHASDLEERIRAADGLKGDVKTLLDKLSASDSALLNEKKRKAELQSEYDELYKKLNKKKRNVGIGSGDVWNDPVVNSLESQLLQARNEANKLKESLGKLKKKNESERNALESQLKKERSRLEDAVDLARAAGDKEKEARELANHVKALQTEIAGLHDRLTCTQDDLAQELDTSIPNEHVLGQLDTLINELRQGHVSKHSPILSTSLREQVIQKPFERLRGHVADVLSNLEMTRDDRDSSLERMKTERDLLREKLARTEEKSRGLASEIAKIQGKLDEAQDNFDRLQAEMNRASGESANKKKQLQAELNEARRQADDAYTRAEKAERELQVSDRQLANAERKLHDMEEDYRNLMSDLNASRGDADKLQRDLDFWKDKLSKEQGKWKEQLAAEAKRAEELVHAMSQDVLELQRELERSKTNGDNMRRMVEEMRVRNDELVRDLQKSKKDLQEKLADAKGKLDKAERENAELKDSMFSLQGDIEQLRNQLMQIRESADKQMQSEREKYAEDMRVLGNDVDEAKEQIKRMKDYYEDELRKVETENGALKAELQETREQLKEFENDRDDLVRMSHDLEQLRNSFRTLECNAKERDNLQALYNQISREVERLAEEVNLLNRRSYDAEQAAIEVQRQTGRDIADAQTQINALHSALIRKEEELQATRDMDHPIMDAQRGEISRLLEKLQQKNLELDSLHRKIKGAHVVQRVDPLGTSYIFQGPSQRIYEHAQDGVGSSGLGVHHHHYDNPKDMSPNVTHVEELDGAPSGGHYYIHHHHTKNKKKKKKKKRKEDVSDKEEFCNVSEHEDLENELSLLEEKLDRSLYHNSRTLLSSHSPTNLELRALEGKVNNAMFRRSLNRTRYSYQ